MLTDGRVIFAKDDCGSRTCFFLVLIRYRQSWCFSGKLLRQKQVTCKSTDDNPTTKRSQITRSGSQAPALKQSRRWPFGVAILTVAQ